jgi:hypothetical protein
LGMLTLITVNNAFTCKNVISIGIFTCLNRILGYSQVLLPYKLPFGAVF